ncbi:MAG: anhydro-N-acetylmuramic acid kinase [Bacteroidia bacterium]|nr:anhydro-N-acetylmuramic acid kinase [Bacteroidales bacterium]NCD42050.1 anhydro-N-acetylmuramic acid kinase [Bacteroidia bacterium]MDD3011522.1 anhydro-N-acetylmuramic acid kinase [Bacteroidales bacterium]MDD3961185.1 anhydro-N-acetylmuramic acid kinase [Bacteroidales bacterium]MDY0284609.1 anhydro-N-acetylmuramic acid kinase [Bacteroidales bacterium]
MATKNQNCYVAAGVMSGTSLDGLDMVLCRFCPRNENWNFQLLKAKTEPYSNTWRQRLATLHLQDARTFVETDRAFGAFIGQQLHEFLAAAPEQPRVIGSHGHTIFHTPLEGITCQIGHGASIAAITGISTVNDFRTTDVALGGEGAPLVPAGDKLLFNQYAQCLNLGGFANLSFEENGKRIAGDIAPCNFILNSLAHQLGFPYDDRGNIAKNGKLILPLLENLNALPFFKRPFPKSLAREWVEHNVLPLISNSGHTPSDILATFTQHVAIQIARQINQAPGTTVLVSGGGAYNKFLVREIQQKTTKTLTIPDNDIIHFKEALIFALLAVLRVNETVNTYAEVTGAQSDSISGALFLPPHTKNKKT